MEASVTWRAAAKSKQQCLSKLQIILKPFEVPCTSSAIVVILLRMSGVEVVPLLLKVQSKEAPSPLKSLDAAINSTKPSLETKPSTARSSAKRTSALACAACAACGGLEDEAFVALPTTQIVTDVLL